MKILNLEGHPNCITGSRVTVILLNGWILPIGGVASGRFCACSLHSRLASVLCQEFIRTFLALLQFFVHIFPVLSQYSEVLFRYFLTTFPVIVWYFPSAVLVFSPNRPTRLIRSSSRDVCPSVRPSVRPYLSCPLPLRFFSRPLIGPQVT